MGIFSTIFARLRDIYAYRREPENARALAVIYWRMILAFALCVIVASLAWGGMLLESALGIIYAEGTSAPRAGAELDRAQLKTTLDNFDARRAHYESLKTAPIQISDPSK